MRHLVFITSILSTAIVMSFCVKMNVKYEWKYVDFVWDSSQQKQQAIDSGNYNASACVLYDVDKARDGRIFVTAVRDKGVPASLMTVTNKNGDGGPLLSPYPDWASYENKACNESITGIYRVYIKCNHLFVLDCGKIGDDRVCPAQLLIFNLKTDELVKRISIPDNVATNKTGAGLLVTPLVLASCCTNVLDTAIVFMADTEGYGLVTWKARTSEFSRIESDFMKPTNTSFNIGGDTFTLHDGILGLTSVAGDLYYAALAGEKMYKMKISDVLRSPSDINQANALTELAGTLTGQTAPIASKHCAIFFSNIPQTSIMCADTSQEINSDNMVTVAQDSETLQFPSGLKVDADVDFGCLMILTNRYQHVATDTLNLNETNFRILSIHIAEIKKQTHCFASCMP